MDILSKFPNEVNTLQNFLNLTIDESQDEMEAKMEREFRPVNACLDLRTIVNLSSVTVPDDILLGLSFGPKFVFPQQVCSDNFVNIITSTIVSFERNLPIETQDEAFKQTSIQLSHYKHKYNSDIETWLLILQYRISKFIKNNPNILITRSDKGKHTVIVPRSTYTEKLYQLINTTDYTKIDSIDINFLESKNNAFVRALSELGSLSDFILPPDVCTLPAQMYGLFKVHKKDFPVRPITSACGSPGFKLAGFLTKVLNVVFPEHGFHTLNSLQTKLALDKIILDHDDELVSFDVVSMFTNITIDVMLLLISERKDIIHEKFNISWPLFVDMFNFALRECAVFSFDSHHYRQNDSLAMGSPLSPILAKILMTKIIDFVLIMYQKKPKLIALYVDDSLWVIPKCDTNLILSFLNSFHNRIVFTMEREKDNSIKFLDIEVIKREDRIVTCWFKKPFASLRILNFFSNHSHTCIVKTAISFIKMVFNLSHDDFFLRNKDILFELLKVNCFPSDVATLIMHENYSLMRPFSYNPKAKTDKYVPIPFFPKFSGSLKSRLASLHPRLQLTSVPDRSTTSHFSYLKDKVKAGHKTNIVLLLQCKCSKYIDIRHTAYGERADSIIKFCKSTFNTTKGDCTTHVHKMNDWRFVRCRHYKEMIARYNALIHLHKDRLQYYSHSSTHPRLRKHLDNF